MDEQLQMILDKGREYADIAGQKGCELVERARLSLKITEAKAELRKEYIRLGKLAYKAIENDKENEKHLSSWLYLIDLSLKLIKEILKMLVIDVVEKM